MPASKPVSAAFRITSSIAVTIYFKYFKDGFNYMYEETSLGSLAPYTSKWKRAKNKLGSFRLYSNKLLDKLKTPFARAQSAYQTANRRRRSYKLELGGIGAWIGGVAWRFLRYPDYATRWAEAGKAVNIPRYFDPVLLPQQLAIVGEALLSFLEFTILYGFMTGFALSFFLDRRIRQWREEE